jgi:xanthosine utilization system XapX-like protein
MSPGTLCFAAVIGLLVIVVWACSKLKSAPPPLIASEDISVFSCI